MNNPDPNERISRIKALASNPLFLLLQARRSLADLEAEEERMKSLREEINKLPLFERPFGPPDGHWHKQFERATKMRELRARIAELEELATAK